MEGGCYERCYENVLNLHMLRDIEEWANSLIFNQSPGSQSLTLIDKNMEVIFVQFKTDKLRELLKGCVWAVTFGPPCI